MTIDWSKAPEGATHAAFTGGPGGHHVWYMIRDDGYDFVYSTDMERGFRKGTGSPGHSPLIERPSGWNGEGLPPVGEVIEWLDGEFLPVVVVGHHQGAVVAVDQNDPRRVFIGKKPCYRPLRTPEQIAAEEREATVQQMIQDIGVSDTDGWDHLRCAALYDAGYRKQVTP